MTQNNKPQEFEPLAYPFRPWCRMVGISPSNAYEKIRQGKIKVLKLGKRTLVPRAESERILREGF